MAYINHERLTEITRRMSEVPGVQQAGMNESTRAIEVLIGRTKDPRGSYDRVMEIGAEYGVEPRIIEEV